MLRDEHRAILEFGGALAGLAAAAQNAGFEADAWRDFRSTSLALVGLLGAHIEKEEMGLLPLLEDLLEAAEDAELAADYLAAR